MEKITTTLILLMSFSAIGQNKLIKQSVVKTPIDSIEVSYKISYPIEIDGHYYDKPIWLKSSLDGMKIVDEKGNNYKRRKCDKTNCGVIHLDKLFDRIIFSGSIIGPSHINTPYYGNRN